MWVDGYVSVVQRVLGVGRMLTFFPGNPQLSTVEKSEVCVNNKLSSLSPDFRL
jgi:hypothetical protein